jgi:ParB-like chromosome segregation protein Spo0J
MSHKFLKFSELRLDPLLQSRVAMAPELVDDYKTAILRGDRMPCISVVFDRQFYFLTDGWHRCAALKAAGKFEVEADIVEGTYRDAMLASFAANSRNGARRTNADKRRAVQRVLDDPEWAQWSNEAIAKACVVSSHTVAEIRQSISANAEMPATRTVERNGTSYQQDTTKIGRKAAPKHAAAVDQSATSAVPLPAWPYPVANSRAPVSPDADPDDEQADVAEVHPAVSANPEASAPVIKTEPDPGKPEGAPAPTQSGSCASLDEDAFGDFDTLTELDFHEICECVPPLSRKEYARLRDDIAQHGLREDVLVLFEGRILDGRHRYKACEETGKTYRTRVFDPAIEGDPGDYVRSKTEGRAMTPDQRAMMIINYDACRIARYRRERDAARQRKQKRQPDTSSDYDTLIEANDKVALRDMLVKQGREIDRLNKLLTVFNRLPLVNQSAGDLAEEIQKPEASAAKPKPRRKVQSSSAGAVEDVVSTQVDGAKPPPTESAAS